MTGAGFPSHLPQFTHTAHILTSLSSKMSKAPYAGAFRRWETIYAPALSEPRACREPWERRVLWAFRERGASKHPA